VANRSPETLGDFISRIRREKNLSLADVSKQSARYGKQIAASYINRLENDPKRRVTADRLAALANGLGVPAQELFTRAVGLDPSGEKSADELYLLTRFRELSPERKADVLTIVELWYSQG
jgi:transcriptional regulator with XRE-family HTH domain